jgi:hypothetical protein
MVRLPGAVVLMALVAAAPATTDRPAAGQPAMPRVGEERASTRAAWLG